MMVSHDRPLKQTIGVDRSRAIDAGKIEIRALEQELARNRKEEDAVKDALLEVGATAVRIFFYPPRGSNSDLFSTPTR
jgi:hypothetical protein